MSLILCLHWSISIEVCCLLLLWNSLSLRLNRRFCCCCVFVRLFVVITFPFLSYAAISYCAVVVVEPYCSPELGVFAQPAPPFLHWDPMLCCCCVRCWQRWLALSQQRVFTVTVGRKHQSHRAGASPPPPPPPPVFFPPDTPGTQPGSNHCEVLLPECSAVFCRLQWWLSLSFSFVIYPYDLYESLWLLCVCRLRR